MRRRWVRGAALTLLGAAIALYAGDWLVFNLRASRTEKVMVSHFISAPLHNNKEELDYLGSEEVALLRFAVSAGRARTVLVSARAQEPGHASLNR